MTDRRRTDWLPFLLVLLSLATPSQGGAAQYLEASEVLSADMEPPVSGRRLEDLFEDNVSVDLDLGEGIEDRILVLHPPAGETREFMTEQRFETSLTVSAEGPHLDLLDWKHHYSPWGGDQAPWAKSVSHVAHRPVRVCKVSEGYERGDTGGRLEGRRHRVGRASTKRYEREEVLVIT